MLSKFSFDIMKVVSSIFAWSLFLSQCQGATCLKNSVCFRQFKAVDGETCPADKSETISNVSCRTQCLVKCKQNDSCRGMLYEQATLKCSFCFTDCLVPREISSGVTTFYKMQGYSPCNESSATFKEYSYKVVSQKLTWEEAKKNCEDLGGYLTSVKSSEEQAHLANMIISSWRFGVWTGAKGTAGNASSFQWLDGTYLASTYEAWYGSEPSDFKGKDCVKLAEHVNYQWKSKNCTEQFGSICKFE